MYRSKPDNAVFLFTANWFATFQYQCVCHSGFLGLNCEFTVNSALYVSGGIFAILYVLGSVLFGMYVPRHMAWT